MNIVSLSGIEPGTLLFQDNHPKRYRGSLIAIFCVG